jgi:hypothetical protein
MSVAGTTVTSSLLSITAEPIDVAPASGPVGTQAVSLVRASTIVETTLTPEDRAFVKLHVQGCDLEALKGHGGCTQHIVAIDLELSLVGLVPKPTAPLRRCGRLVPD